MSAHAALVWPSPKDRCVSAFALPIATTNKHTRRSSVLTEARSVNTWSSPVLAGHDPAIMAERAVNAATGSVRTNRRSGRTNHASLSAEFASVCFLGVKCAMNGTKTRLCGEEMPTFGTMSSNLPTDPADVITFVSSRASVWALNQPLIGSTPAEVAAVEAILAEAKAAMRAAGIARDAARSATQQYYDAARRLRNASRIVVDNAKNLARASDDASVYQHARLNAPKVRARQAPPPGKPVRVECEAKQFGQVVVTWKCANPRGLHGVVYEVLRRTLEVSERDGKRVVKWGPMEHIGIAGGDKRFVDTTVPVGVPQVSYMIVSMHNGRKGETSNETPLQFGTQMRTTGATVTAKATQAVEPKMSGKPSLAA